MTTGYLWYNAEERRYGVIDAADLWAIDGLHCGACMEALVNDAWLPVRLEYNASAHELSVGGILSATTATSLTACRCA